MAVSATRVTIAWIQAIPGVTAAVGDRVWDELVADPTLPAIIVQEIGGGDTSVLPVTRPYMQVDVYGPKGAKAATDDLAGLITDHARTETMTPIPAESATVMTANWVAKRRVEEPLTGWERWALDLLLTIRED